MAEKRPYIRGGKTHRHVVKVTDAEELQLQDKAAQLGVTVSRFLADTALGTVPVVKNKVAVTELFGIRRQVIGEATNLNQLVMESNSGTVFEAEILAALSDVRASCAAIDRWASDN